MEVLAEWYAELMRLRAEWGTVVDIFLVVLAVLVVNLLLRLGCSYLVRRVENSDSLWDDAIYRSVNGPLRAAVWIAGLSVAARIGSPPDDSLLATFLPPAQTLGIVAVMTWFLSQLITAVEANLIKRSIRRGNPIDQTTADAIAKLLRAAVVITAVLVALQSLGVSISGVLAFGGIGGIAVGFASRDFLANLLGGLTIYMNRPFSVGDWIRSPDKDIEGVVEAVGWRATTVRRFDKRPLYVPNQIFTTVALENPSRMTHRRILETIGLRYDDAAVVVPIVSEIREMLENYDEIDNQEVILVYFNTFGAHSLDFFVYCYTVTRVWAEYHAVKQEVLTRCYDIIRRHGGDVAFPTTTVHVPEGLDMRQEQPETAGAQAGD